MNKISIPVYHAYDAIMWCRDHFTHFEVQHQFPANLYEFRFEKPEHASLFALKWIQ